MLFSLLFFFFITLGLGFAISRLLKVKPDGDFEAFFSYLACGLVAFVILSVFLGFLHIANWLVYAGITVALLAAAWHREKAVPSFRIPKLDKSWIIVLILFAAHLYVYVQGAWAYPYLEDDDPWEHAAAIRYVAEFATYIQPEHLPMHYLAPYPPFYDVLLGVLFQIDGESIQAILKNFNALLVSLAIPMFYLFARGRFGARTGLWATFMLAVLPCFMSHFIWSQTLCLLLAFPALYFLDKFLKSEGEEKKGYCILAVFGSATVFMTQPSTAAMYFGLLAAYIVSKTISVFLSKEEKDWKGVKEMAIVFGAAFVLALLLFWIPMFVMYPVDAIMEKLSLSVGILTEKEGDTGGGLVYGFSDFFDAPEASKMDQPTGFGEAVLILVIVGLLWALNEVREGRGSHAVITAILWLLYGFVGTEGNLLPVKLVPHRFWVFLAIAAAITAAMGALAILNIIEKKKKEALFAFTVLIVLAVIWTSAIPKYIVETSQWPPGVVWASYEQIGGYVNLMENLPANTKVYSFCLNEKHINGFDLYGYAWEKDMAAKSWTITATNDENYALLSKYGYEYAIVDQGCIMRFDGAQIQSKVDSLMADGRFEYVEGLSSNTFILFRIR